MPAHPLHSRDGLLHLEQVSLEAIAETYGTPCYVYSGRAIAQAWQAYDDAFGAHPHRVCYAVKANGSLAILALLARLGASFDVVSGGELDRVLRAGGDPTRVVFSGVGKSTAELDLALRVGVGCINVESPDELERLNAMAMARGLRAPVALRVNPEVDAQTHPYIATALEDSKFGIPVPAALTLYRQMHGMPGVQPLGIACHIGSQLTDLAPLREAARRVAELARSLNDEGLGLRHLDLGGGLGIAYQDQAVPSAQEYVAALLEATGAGGLETCIEPGRSIVGPAGVLLTRVEYLKDAPRRGFAVVDAAMNDLARPALYEAWHGIVPVRSRPGTGRAWDIVGPVCESGDWLGRERVLNLAPGDLLAVRDAGAYGYAMASNYNARPRPPEVLVDGAAHQLIRARESLDDLARGERIPGPA